MSAFGDVFREIRMAWRHRTARRCLAGHAKAFLFTFLILFLLAPGFLSDETGLVVRPLKWRRSIDAIEIHAGYPHWLSIIVNQYMYVFDSWSSAYHTLTYTCVWRGVLWGIQINTVCFQLSFFACALLAFIPVSVSYLIRRQRYWIALFQ